MNLRKLVPILIVLVAFAGGIAERQANAQAASQRKPRIAVLDFDYATVRSTSSAVFGTNIDVGKGISDLLVTNLVKDGTFSIIERAALDKVLAEQDFSNSNRADPATAARLGKILGADYIVVGSITEFGNETNKQSASGSGGSWRGIGIGGLGHSDSKANVGVTARVINIDTAEILSVAEGKGQSSRSSVSLLGGGGNWRGFGAGKVDFSSRDFQATIIGEATKQAVDKLSTDLVSNAGKLSVRAVQAEGLIAAIEGDQIILNVGSRAGIHLGDKLEVSRTGREIKDPATGQVIRRLSSSVGTIQVIDVDEVSAVGRAVSGTGFKEGDRVGSGAGSTPITAPAGLAVSSQSGSSAPAPVASAKPSQAAAAPAASGQPDLTALKSEFIPGEKAVFEDDFSDMPGDAPPPHWKIRGGTAELRVGDGVRQLTLRGRNVDMTPNMTALPTNFTLESEVVYSNHGGVAEWVFPDKAGKELMFFRTSRNYTKLMVTFRAGGEQIVSDQYETDFNQPVQEQLWAQNGRLRLYINGRRVFDVNQIELKDMAPPKLRTSVVNKPETEYIGLRPVRFAESTPDFSQIIVSSGRFVTHGILFDTDSDRLKPESAAVIASIARGLSATPDLKVQIDGHTDSTGEAAHNMDLSKRRAEAVKTVLVSQFNVDAARLTTAGLGATKPIAPNTTAEGKAQNRRVEFVRK